MLNCGLTANVTPPNQKWAVGKCACGACTVSQRRPGGIVTFNCHCEACRAFFKDDKETKGEHSVLSLDWCCNVKSSGPIEWSDGQGANRGVCRECKQPVVHYGFGAWSIFSVPAGSAMNRGLPPGDKMKPEFNAYWDFGGKVKNAKDDTKSLTRAEEEREDYGLPTWTGNCGNFCNFAWLLCPRTCCCCVQGTKPCCICC